MSKRKRGDEDVQRLQSAVVSVSWRDARYRTAGGRGLLMLAAALITVFHHGSGRSLLAELKAKTSVVRRCRGTIDSADDTLFELACACGALGLADASMPDSTNESRATDGLSVVHCRLARAAVLLLPAEALARHHARRDLKHLVSFVASTADDAACILVGAPDMLHQFIPFMAARAWGETAPLELHPSLASLDTYVHYLSHDLRYRLPSLEDRGVVEALIGRVEWLSIVVASHPLTIEEPSEHVLFAVLDILHQEMAAAGLEFRGGRQDTAAGRWFARGRRDEDVRKRTPLREALIAREAALQRAAAEASADLDTPCSPPPQSLASQPKRLANS